MRILFVNKASLRHEGGAEIRSKEIGKRLAAAGHEVVVLAARTNINEASCEIFEGMKLYHKKVLPDWVIRRWPAPRYFPLAAANLFLMFHIYFLLQRERFDIIREDISPFPPSFLLSLVRLPAMKRTAVAHNLPGTFQGWLRFYGLLYGTVGYLFYRLMRADILKYDRIVCAARWFADELKRFPAIAEKVGYVPNGIDLEQFAKIETRQTRAENIRLLAVGRLVEMKGFRFLVEAVARLKGEYPHVKLAILGSGPLKDPLLQMARRMHIEDNVEIIPPVPYEGMPQVYHQHDFLVAPYLSEGFPMVVLEAMAAHLPIIASDIPGVRGILDDHAAILVRSRNAEDIEDKLKWAIAHPAEVAQRTDAAYSLAKRYNWDDIARQELNK